MRRGHGGSVGKMDVVWRVKSLYGDCAALDSPEGATLTLMNNDDGTKTELVRYHGTFFSVFKATMRKQSGERSER